MKIFKMKFKFGDTTSNSTDSQLNAVDFFSGAFNSQTKSVLSDSNRNFTNIEIPDFLKR